MVDVNAIMDYEDGSLSAQAELELFSELVKSGTAWQLQGHYGRTARSYIDQGLLYEDGEISSYARDLLADMAEEDPTDWDSRIKEEYL
jgi:hypothetical protein